MRFLNLNTVQWFNLRLGDGYVVLSTYGTGFLTQTDRYWIKYFRLWLRNPFSCKRAKGTMRKRNHCETLKRLPIREFQTKRCIKFDQDNIVLIRHSERVLIPVIACQFIFFAISRWVVIGDNLRPNCTTHSHYCLHDLCLDFVRRNIQNHLRCGGQRLPKKTESHWWALWE